MVQPGAIFCVSAAGNPGGRRRGPGSPVRHSAESTTMRCAQYSAGCPAGTASSAVIPRASFSGNQTSSWSENAK